MKFDPHLPQLPSIGELLEHPRVKGVVERINRSTLAHRAAGFLEEMRSTLVDRAGGIEIPSVGQLAERLWRRLLGEPAHGGAVINATGLAVGDPQLAPPLSEASLHAVLHVAGEYHGLQYEGRESLERALCDLTGAEAALVTANYRAVVMLASGVHAETACRVEMDSLAGLLNPRDYGLASIETIGQRLSAGAALVVADGAGLLGGPACGLLVGERRAVARAASQSLAPTFAADALTMAALDATLAAYREETLPAVHTIPLWQLLSAPLANLEQRARRLALLIAESPAIQASEPREVESPWAKRDGESFAAKSWAIFLRPATGSASLLASLLRRGAYPIVSREAPDGVLLDLRTVFPRWDQQLVATVDASQG